MINALINVDLKFINYPNPAIKDVIPHLMGNPVP